MKHRVLVIGALAAVLLRGLSERQVQGNEA